MSDTWGVDEKVNGRGLPLAAHVEAVAADALREVFAGPADRSTGIAIIADEIRNALAGAYARVDDSKCTACSGRGTREIVPDVHDPTPECVECDGTGHVRVQETLAACAKSHARIIAFLDALTAPPKRPRFP